MLKTRIHMFRTKIFRAAAICLAALVAVSCDKAAEGALYEGESGFAFASSVLYAEVSSENKGTIEIPIYRGVSDGVAEQATVSFKYDTAPQDAADPVWKDADPDGVFSLISPKVTFAENSCSASVRLRFKGVDKLKTSEKYRMRLDILDGVSPSGRSSVTITVTKKLVFKKYGDCTYFDECIFEKAYETEIYKAEGEEIYRVMDPYREGLIAEEYAANGWMGSTPDYVEFQCSGEQIVFSEFPTGMLFNGKYMAYAYFPSDYEWGRDFSKYDAQNLKLDDKHFQLYAVYCLPEFQYGYMNDGIYKIDIDIL